MAQAIPPPATGETPATGTRALIDRPWLPAVILLLLTVAAYLPVLRCGFVWDDDAYVTKNALIQSPGDFSKFWLDRYSTPQYYPLVFSTFWLEYRLWGLNPAGYHVTNVLLHALNAWLVFALVSRWHRGAAWWTAMLFALHPIHVESVAWITERKNVLSAAFYLGAFLNYWDWRVAKETPAADSTAARPAGYLMALGLFVLALLSKSITATLPAAILVALWWRNETLRWTDFLPLVPFFVLGIAFGLHTAWLERTHVFAQTGDLEWSVARRLTVAGAVPWFYLAKIIWPFPLIFFYPRWAIDGTHLADWIPLLGTAGLIALLVVKRFAWGRWPLAATLYFGGTLFPVLGLLPVYPMRFSVVADHFVYLASIGPLIVVGVAVSAAIQARPLLISLTPVLAIGLGGLVWLQLCDYRDVTTLWTRTLVKNPDCYVCYNDLALEEKSLVEREKLLRKSLALAPKFELAWSNLGECLQDQERTDEAIAAYEQALAVEPRYMLVHLKLSHVHEDRGELPLAVDHARRATRFRPGAGEYANLGRLLLSTGAVNEGRRYLARALELSPGHVEALTNLAVLSAIDGNLPNAQELLERAAVEEPGNPQVLGGLGRICWDRRRYAESAAWFSRLLERSPADPLATSRIALYLAAAPAEAGRDAPRARLLAEKALESAGPVPELVLIHAVALAANGDWDGARKELERVRAAIPPGVQPVVPMVPFEKAIETRTPWQLPAGNSR